MNDIWKMILQAKTDNREGVRVDQKLELDEEQLE